MPIIVLILCLLLIAPSSVFSDDNQAQLNRIRSRIGQTEKNLKTKKRTEVNISRELALLRKTLQRVDGRIGNLKDDQKEMRAQISDLERSLREKKAASRKITARLHKRLVALYKEGDSGVLKILFSADSPTEMAQQYQYLTRVLEHDRELIEEYRVVYLAQQQQLEQKRALEQKQRDLIASEQKQRDIAANGKKLNTRLLARARKEKGRLAQELKNLRENSRRLTALIKELKQKEVVAPPPAEVHVAPPTGEYANHFAVGRGKLRWPLKGRVLIGYGRQKDSKLGTYYESNGLEIAAPSGAAIKAVASGTIVFADYFKNYGNLYILMHPGGYHTLYAHIDRMQHKVGTKVKAGTLLGYSGLGGRDSIYFEIRSQGAAVNPLSWLSKR